MNTIPSHLVINAAIEKKFGEKFKLAKSAFLWGSVTPDFPLGIISIAYFLYYRYFTTENISSIMDNAFGNMYFNNPVWIAGHNLLHSPTALLIYAIFLWRFVNQAGTRGHWWLSFVFGCMVHSVIDIFTHFDDGPVLFFPFDWHTRFYSPVSYWDRNHYANEFFWVELGINIVLLAYLFLPKLIARFRKKTDN
jgi:hypothetical protein